MTEAPDWPLECLFFEVSFLLEVGFVLLSLAFKICISLVRVDTALLVDFLTISCISSGARLGWRSMRSWVLVVVVSCRTSVEYASRLEVT